MKGVSSTHTLSGKAFEGAVAQLHALLAPDAQVTHDERLVDRLGHSRQFDVVMRSKLGGYELLSVIECKDLRGKVGTPEVNAFADKAANVRANLKVIASRMGFTRPAMELAAHHGIALISLLKTPGEKRGFVAPSYWYMKARRWTCEDLMLFTDGPGPGEGFDAGEVVISGQSLEPFLAWAMNTRHNDVASLGSYEYQLAFANGQPMVIGAKQFVVMSVALQLTRQEQLFRQRVNYVGDAYFDWSNGRIVLPPGCRIQSEPVKMTEAAWEPIDSIDELASPFVAQLTINEQVALVGPPEIDLATLGREELLAIAS